MVTLRVRPQQAKQVETYSLSSSYQFSMLVRLIDEALTTHRKFAVRTAEGQTLTVNPATCDIIAVRHEF